EVARLVPERRVRGLKMHGPGIVNPGSDAPCVQSASDGIAAIDICDEQVVDALTARVVPGEIHTRPGEPLLVHAHDVPSSRRPRVKVLQLDAQDRALKSVHPVVVADMLVDIAAALAMAA